MNYSLANKKVSISGKVVITDWREVKIVSPENLQEKIKANENVKKELQKQDVTPTTSSNTATAVSL
jgi:predicted HAD superfamily Cof-like phosphohydrolase